MRCATHPDVETSLTCSKCGRPICPKCMVPTPVGARCPDCARLSKLPTYRVSAPFYLRAIGAGLGVAVLGGAIWALAGSIIPFFHFNLLLAPVFGYAIGEVISLAVNRKRGVGLATIAGLMVTVSYLLSIFLPWGARFHFLDLLALALGIWVAVTCLR